jgi:hypothetical protein
MFPALLVLVGAGLASGKAVTTYCTVALPRELESSLAEDRDPERANAESLSPREIAEALDTAQTDESEQRQRAAVLAVLPSSDRRMALPALRRFVRRGAALASKRGVSGDRRWEPI